MPLNAKLVVVGGDVKTEEIKLRLPSTIGRGRGTSIMLAHPLVSRQHCELFEANGQLMVRDLGSLNGTFVNNQRITEAPLQPGELLTIGTVTFRAVYDSPKAGAGKGAAPAKKAEKKPAAAGSKASAPTPKPPTRPKEQEKVDFDFDKPLVDFDDDTTTPTEAAKSATRRVETTVRDKQERPTERVKTVPAPAKPAAPPPDAAKSKKASAKEDSVEFDLAPLNADSEDDDQVSSSGDDDLNDFLKSLEK
jgi:hypothetical protein